MCKTLLPIALFAACLASCGKKPKEPDSPPATEPTELEIRQRLTPVYRFWDKRHNEHVYTFEGTEPADWRKSGFFENETTIGYALNFPEPDTVRLTRLYRRDGRHYFYLTAPSNVTDVERVEPFELYVWTKPGDGRVPVHACILPDSTDAFFERNLEHVKKYTEGTLKGIGKQRTIAESLFYLYPTTTRTPPPPPPPIKPTINVPGETQRESEATETLRARGGTVQRNKDRSVFAFDLSGKKFDDSAGEQLKELRSLRQLVIGWNPITDALLNQIRGTSGNLEELHVEMTKVTDAGVIPFCSAAPRLKVMNVTGDIGVTDASLPHIAKLPIERLYLTGTSVTDMGLASLQNHKTLEELYCGNRGVKDAGVAHLKNSSRLRSLALGDSSVTDTGLAHLKRLTSLEFLVLDRTSVTDAGLPNLHGLKKLNNLRLTRTKVTPAGVASLTKALPGLKVERDGSTGSEF